MFIFKKIVVWK